MSTRRLLSSLTALLTTTLLLTPTSDARATSLAPTPAVTPTVADAAPQGERLLLRLHEVRAYPEGTGEALAAVFRDGLVVLFNTAPDGTLTIFRHDLGPGGLAFLHQELAATRVATLEGACDVFASIAPGIDLPSDEIGQWGTFSWFGLKGNRSNHMVLGNANVTDNFGTRCSDEVLDITHTAWNFVRGLFAPPITPPVIQRADDQFLYVVHNTLQEDTDCGDGGFVDDAFIFRDGLVIRDARNSDGRFIFERGQATETARRELNLAFAGNRVGFQAGQCKTSFFQPFSVEGGCTDYSWQSGGTWFGAGERRATLFSTDMTEDLCVYEQDEIAGAVTQFVRNTGAQPQTQRVTGQLPTF